MSTRKIGIPTHHAPRIRANWILLHIGRPIARRARHSDAICCSIKHETREGAARIDERTITLVLMTRERKARTNSAFASKGAYSKDN